MRGFCYHDTLRRLHADGYTDSEIGKVVGRSRIAVGSQRRKLGLPSNRFHERYRSRARANMESHLRKVGAKNLQSLRLAAHRQYAEQNGWPSDLRAREVHILNALLERGPMTRRQMCDAIGLPWRGSNKSMKCTDPGGTHTATLINRGLVVYLGKINGVGVYSLALSAEPVPVAERMLA